MANPKRTFYYQPAPLTTIMCWSWTLVLLLLGIIFWLEITHFSWITLFLFILFGFMATCEVFFRKITIDNERFKVGHVLNPKWLDIDMNQISRLETSKYQIKFDYDGRHYCFVLPANSVIEINGIINAY